MNMNEVVARNMARPSQQVNYASMSPEQEAASRFNSRYRLGRGTRPPSPPDVFGRYPVSTKKYMPQRDMQRLNQSMEQRRAARMTPQTPVLSPYTAQLRPTSAQPASTTSYQQLMDAYRRYMQNMEGA